MILNPIEVKDKRGQCIVLRSAEEADAEDMLRYMKETSAETSWLLREPEENRMTMEREISFIREMQESERDLMLVATMDGTHIGNASFNSSGRFQRLAHRCGVAIALYRKYWGRGIGEQMMRVLLAEAKKAGYEQAELEVVADNKAAVALYEKIGFQTHGHLPRYMKYKDGSYADALWMAKEL